MEKALVKRKSNFARYGLGDKIFLLTGYTLLGLFVLAIIGPMVYIVIASFMDHITLQNKGIVLSRDRILNEVWGYDSFGVDRTVDWQIKLLRGKLGEYRDCIKTIRGVGYKFES